MKPSNDMMKDADREVPEEDRRYQRKLDRSRATLILSQFVVVRQCPIVIAIA